MAWQPPEEYFDDAKKTGWKPPEEYFDDSLAKIKDVGTLQQMKQSGQELSRDQERILFDAEDAKPIAQKASEAISTFVPTAIDIAKQLGTGAGEFLYKGVLKPIDAISQSPEEADKTLKEAKNTWRSFASGVAGDIQETADAAVRFSMFGSNITDKLLGRSNEERFEKYMLREGMRQFAQKVYEDDPDNAARLLAENPLLQKLASAAALAQGATAEEAELAKKAYEDLVKEQGLTKEEINENVSLFGEIMSPLSLPGTNRITDAFGKATGKVTQKAGELALKGVVAPIAKGVAKTAGVVETGVEKIQNLSRKIGEYTIGDPDTLIKTAANTVVGPAKLPAKMTKGIATTIADVASQAGPGRRGMFERAGREATSSEITKKLFGPEALGGKGRARAADWAVRQANAIIQPAVNGAVLNIALGLPDIETARDLGYSAGVGAGIGAYGGARLMERGAALIDPTTGLAEKIDAVITPDPAQLRKDQDADIQRFVQTADPTLMSSIDELSNVNNIKSALDLKIKNLEAKKVAQIRKEDEKRIQDQIDIFTQQRKGLDKSTPQTEAEIKRQVQLSFADAMDLAKTTGAAAGLNNIQVKVLRPDQMDDFYRDLYGKTLTDAESVVRQLVGNPQLSPSEQELLNQANQTIKQYLQDVAGASTARGFAISERTGQPDHLKLQNQKGATVVINGDLVAQMGRDGLNLGRVINHEMQHALSNFQEVRDMLAPIRKELFDQKILNPDGTFETVSKGIVSDADLDKFALQYAAAMDSAGGASFLSQFANQDQLRNYMKEEYLSELAGLSGGIQGNLRDNLDSVGRSVVDWIESRTKNGVLKRIKEGLRNYGVIVDDQGQFSSVIGTELNPEAMAMMRQYQRGLRDLNESMVYNSDPLKDAPEIPLTELATNRALQERYKHSDFFEQEQVVKMTTPDGQVQEIVVPPGVKIDSFVSDYRFANGQLVDEQGNPISLGPDIPLQAMPDGTSISVDTRIARNADGSPRILSPRESKRRAKKRGEAIRKVIDEAADDGSGVRLEDTGNGNYRGTLSPTQIAAINALPNDLVAPSLKRKIAFFNDILGRKDGSIVEIEYQAALRDGKYRALQPQMRTEIPIGFQFDKQGNFLMTTMSLSRMHDKANAWAAKRPRNLSLWGGDMTKFWDSVRQYLYNHKQGLQGHIGLNADPAIAMDMKNRINDLFNVYRKETREANPERTTLPKRRGQDSRDVVIRSRRMDRVNSYDETALPKMPFSYELAVQNYLPAENPFAELQTPEQFAQGMEIDTELARLAAQGNVEPLELQLHEQDLLRPAEYVDVQDGKLRVRSMFDPTQTVFDPMESEPEKPSLEVVETEVEMPQERVRFLSSELDKMYAAGGTDKNINAYESELEQIYQKLDSQAEDREATTEDFEEAPEITEADIMNSPTDLIAQAVDNYNTGRVDNKNQTLPEYIRSVVNETGSLQISPDVTDEQIATAADDVVQYRESLKNRIRSGTEFSNAVVAPAGIQYLPAFHASRVNIKDKFNIDFVNTGNKEQVYGWGLYFSENKKEIDKFVPLQYRYKVDLDVDESNLLNWERSLDPRLKDAAEILTRKIELDSFSPVKITTNQDYYEALSAYLEDPKSASMQLKQMGIDGIKYLDRITREKVKETGIDSGKIMSIPKTYNYVIFDDSKIKILDKGDKSLGPVIQFMPADAEGAMPPEQPQGMKGVEAPQTYRRISDMILPLQGVELPEKITAPVLPKQVEKTMKEDAGDFSVVIGGKPGKYGFEYTSVAKLQPELELSEQRKKDILETLAPRNEEFNKKRDALMEIGNLWWENNDLLNKQNKSDEDRSRMKEVNQFLQEFMAKDDKEFTIDDAIQVAQVDRLTKRINELQRGMTPAPFKFPVDNREVPVPVEKPADINPDASKEDKAKYAKELAAYETYVALVKKREQDVSIGLKSLQGAVATLFKTKKFKEFIAEAAGLTGIQFDNILGTWKFEPEPSFVFSAQDMTWEQAQSVTKWLSVLMTQDAGIAWKPSIGLTEGAPSVYLVHNKKLTEDQIIKAFEKAKQVGIDGLSVTVDGKGIKAANFDGIEGFYDKLGEIQKAAGIKNFHDTLVDSFYYDTTSDFTAEDGSTRVPDWLKGASINEKNIQDQQGRGEEAGGIGREYATTGGLSVLLRGGIDSVLVPYAKALAGEGFTFDPDRFAERYGLGQEVADYIREQLYPATGLSRSVTPILEGTEKFVVPESFYTKDGKLKTSVNDLMYALQRRSADDGFIVPGDYSPRAGQIISETIVDEVVGHMERAKQNPDAPNAIGWYDAALKRMKAEYAKYFPFLNRNSKNYNADKEFVFDSVLGITSQGNNVFENGKMAARIQFLLENGKTLPEIASEEFLYDTFGGQTRAIENNLLKLDELLKNNDTQTLDKIFRKKMTVSEWNAYLKKNKNFYFKGEPLSVDGKSDQMVTGFSVFGPKIGSFINNLHGDYSTLTADLWYTRTWNRILGNVFQHASLKEAKQYDAFRKALLEQYRKNKTESYGREFKPFVKKTNSEGKEILFDYFNETELEGLTENEFGELINDPQRMLDFATALEDRFRSGQYKTKSDLRRAAKNWVENRSDPVAAPRTDLERDFQQNVMEIAQKKLRRKGIDISIADMQAALWYNEKELFGLYGAQVSGAEPADYADSAENVSELMSYGTLFQLERQVEQQDGTKKKEIVRLVPYDTELKLTKIKDAKTPEEYAQLVAARKKAIADAKKEDKKLEKAELKVEETRNQLAKVDPTDQKSKQKAEAALAKAEKLLADLKPPVVAPVAPLTGIKSPVE